MPFDTNMYGKIDMQTPMRLGALLDPANIQRQRADQMATQDKIAGMQEARTLRDLLQGAPDIQTAQQRLAQAGKWNEAAKLQGVIQTQQQGQIAAQEKQRKQALEQAVFAASLNPSDDAFRAVLSASGVDPTMHDQAIAQLPKDPTQRAAMIALPPAKRAELEFQMRKQEEAKAADLARQTQRDEATSARDAARYAQQDKTQSAQLAATLAAINARKADAPSGKPPVGYRFTHQGDLEAIPGGPADSKKIAAEEKARALAAKATDFADMGIGVIDQLLASPGLGRITGWSSKIPIIPGTDQAQADALALQIEGQAFLQAFQSLKGGGAITEKEGEKATAAIARLKRAQSEQDYRKALTELRGVLATTKQRSEGAQPAQPAATQLPAGMPSNEAIQAEKARRAALKQGGR